MKHKPFAKNVVKRHVACIALSVLTFGGCSATEADYADRNDIDSARSPWAQRTFNQVAFWVTQRPEGSVVRVITLIIFH